MVCVSVCVSVSVCASERARSMATVSDDQVGSELRVHVCMFGSLAERARERDRERKRDRDLVSALHQR